MEGTRFDRLGRNHNQIAAPLGPAHRTGRVEPALGRARVESAAHGAPRDANGAAASDQHNGEAAGTASVADQPHTSPVALFRSNLTEALGAETVARHLDTDVRWDEQGDTLTLRVGSTFHKGVLERRFAVPLRTSLEGTGLTSLAIEVDEASRAAPPPATPAAAPGGSQRRQAARTRQRRAADRGRYDLSAFVVGPSNRMAYSTVLRVATETDGHAFSPVFVHGGSGLGKTHLLRGAAAAFERANPGARVRYTTAESFTNAYVSALRSNSLDAFRRTWRGVDLLCVDDVHFFSGKVSTQGELLHTFDAIDLEGSRVILASDAHPRQIRELSPSLVSRLMSRAVVRVEAPDEPMRLALIRRLAAKRGAALSEDAAMLLAARAGVGEGASVRELEGMLTQVIAVAELLPEFLSDRREIGVLAVKRSLGLGEWAGVRSSGARPVRLERIIERSCSALGVEAGDVFGRTRHRRVVLARTLIAYLSRTMTAKSFPEIARAMRRPTHSTIVAAKQRFDAQLARDEVVAVGSPLDGLTVGQLADRVRADIEASDEG